MLARLARDLATGLALSCSVALPCLGCGDDAAVIILPGPPRAEGGMMEGSSASDAPRSGAESGTGSVGTSSSVSGLAPGADGAGEGSGATGARDGSSGNIPPTGPGSPLPGSTASDREVQAWVFDDAEVHAYEFTLDPAVWAALQQNARDEQYVQADFRADGQALERVGLRFKGSLGTLSSCFEDDGTPRCSKMSMKVKFDEYRPEQRFAGLKRLNFNSMLFDDSLMHERLAYRVFREMGITAPRSVHARLIINGEDAGLFSLVEDVDGRFTENHFEDGDGNLYKEAWPSNADDEILAQALETNEEVANNSGFMLFQAALLAAAPSELPGVLESYVDVDRTLAYLAVDQTLTNWDGITAFYCYEGFCENHNYFWYQEGAGPRFALIPWDLDNTFSPSPLTGVPGPFETPADCSMLYLAMGRTLRAPGCDPLIQGLALTSGARYVAELDRLLDGPLAAGNLEGWIDELEAQLVPEVMTDARGPDLEAFEAEVGRLRSAVESLRERAIVDRGTHL